MPLVDVHTHLFHDQFKDDLDEVMDRAKHVKLIIDNGLNPETNRLVLENVKKYENVKAALGIYPVDAVEMTEAQIQEELEFIKKQGLVALGEVGLDLHWLEKLDGQKEVFQEFIQLSEKTKLPLIIHSRKAEQEVLEMLDSSQVKNAILHSFGGNKKLVKWAADSGRMFSIPPSCVNATHFQMIIQEANINQLLTETDAPYLGPVKGERNEPANVSYTIKKIAELKGFEEVEVENNIFMNAQRLFF